ncbi:MAG: DMT family transporter [Candidatus Bathyarchaeia archaeon]
MKKRSWILFTVVVLIWSSNWTFMKVGLKFVNPLNLVTQRIILASIFILPALLWRRSLLPKSGEVWFKAIFLSLINAVGMTFSNVGLMFETTGLSSILTYTQPIFVFCLAVPLLGEKASLAKVLGVILSFLGIATLYADKLYSPSSSPEALLFLISGAFLWAVTIVYYKKFLGSLDPFIVNAIQFIFGSVFLLAIALMLGGVNFSSAPIYIFSLLYMSILGSVIAMTIYLLLVKEEETVIVSTSSLMVPALALIFGWFFLKETMEFYSILGFLLILFGVYIVNKYH